MASSTPSVPQRVRELAGELAVLLNVDDVLYVEDARGQKRADWLANEIGRELGLPWPEFTGPRWTEPHLERVRPAWDHGE